MLERDGSLTNLTRRLDPVDRYSTIFEGNSEQIDHILGSSNLAATGDFDIVHVNTIDPAPITDHDPTITRFGLAAALSYPEGAADVDLHAKAIGQTMRPGGGDDAVTGTALADTLYGGAGFDRLRGGAGDDTLVGGQGHDRMRGGTGDDTFLFAAGDLVDPRANGRQMDHIIDFHGAGSSGGGEQDFLSFTGFGAGARLVFDRTLGNDPALQIYDVTTGTEYRGLLLVQMAGMTNHPTADDHFFMA